jgi:hypothetical protein
VNRIAAGDYDGLARDFTAHADESDYDLGLWARGYPATFTPLLPEAWKYADAFYIAERDHWHVVLDLWSAEEGRSDLTLEVMISEHAGQIELVITDLHVM